MSLQGVQHDQAAGLRRLLAPGTAASVTVVSGSRGSGKTSTVMNLACALAANGRKVLVVDECAEGVAAALGLAARHDLLHAVRGEHSLEEIVLQGPDGVSILAAQRSVQALPRLGAAGRERLARCFGTLARRHDVLLIDSAAGTHSLGHAAQEALIVLSPAPASITDAYTLIKNLHHEYARRHFRILVNRAGSAADAHAVFANLSGAARRYLAVTLEFGGWIPRDEQLRHATRLARPVVAAFPDAASAGSFRTLADALGGWPAAGGEDARLEDFIRSTLFAPQSAAVHFS